MTLITKYARDTLTNRTDDGASAPKAPTNSSPFALPPPKTPKAKRQKPSRKHSPNPYFTPIRWESHR